MSEVTGCDYCVAAHTLLGKLAGLKPDALRQIRTGAQLVDISLAIALTIFTNVFNRINDTDIDFPAVA